jgi:flagellar motor switch protein FliM
MSDGALSQDEIDALLAGVDGSSLGSFGQSKSQRDPLDAIEATRIIRDLQMENQVLKKQMGQVIPHLKKLTQAHKELEKLVKIVSLVPDDFVLPK